MQVFADGRVILLATFADALSVYEESFITAGTVWGVLRALETFSQLLYTAEDGSSVSKWSCSGAFEQVPVPDSGERHKHPGFSAFSF